MEWLTKRTDALSVEGRIRRRLRVRWENCMKRERLGGDWRMRAGDGGSGDGWQRLQ